MNIAEAAAFERLLMIAHSDTGQVKRVADFILVWWNASTHGGFDISDLFGVDAAVAKDMAAIFSFLSCCPDAVYPNDYREDIEAIIRTWRPETWARSAGGSVPEAVSTS